MSTQFTDDFNRADSGSLGANYTSLGSSFTVVSNQAAPPASGGSDYVNAATPGAACWAQFTAVTNVAPSNYLGLGLRFNSGSFNGYYAAWDTGGMSLYRIDGGTPTALGATGLTAPSNGDVVRVEMHGSTLRIYYNNTLQTTRTDTTYSAAGSVLLLGASTSARLDNLSLGTLPTLSSPTPSGTLGTSTTATVGCTTDEAAGTLYVVVDQGSLAAVTAAQIIAGQDAGGAAADASGNNSVSTTTPSVSITGLVASTAYNYAILQVSGGYSNIVTGSFTTAAASATLDQEGFRFGEDDGAENAHTWAAAVDTNLTAPAGQTKLLNIIINATGDPATKVFKLQHRKVGDPTWKDTPVI